MVDAESLAPKLALAVPAGTVLFRQGDAGQEMFIIVAGAIRVTRVVGAAERTLAVLGPGEFVGEMSILTGEPRTATATVLEDARVVPIDAGMLEQIVARSSEVAVRLLKRLAFRLQASNDLIEVLLHRDVRVRVVMGLALLVETAGVERREGGVFIDVTPDDLAEQVGVTSAEVLEVLGRLSRSGLVVADPRGGFILRDIERLREFVDFIATREELGELDGEA
jgi:CRP-like cAMP-binding protein